MYAIARSKRESSSCETRVAVSALASAAAARAPHNNTVAVARQHRPPYANNSRPRTRRNGLRARRHRLPRREPRLAAEHLRAVGAHNRDRRRREEDHDAPRDERAVGALPEGGSRDAGVNHRERQQVREMRGR